MIEKQSPLLFSGLKVGIVYNFPEIDYYKNKERDYEADADILEEVESIEDALIKLDLNYQRMPLYDDIKVLINSVKKYNPDVVINLCEAAWGDSHLEMAVASMIELLRMPYTGCPPLALGLCQNKGLSKDIMRAEGISTPNYRILKRYEDWKRDLVYPLFVKPLSEDGSIGITRDSFVENDTELKRQTDYLTEYYKQPVLVEQYISGREVNISIIGDLYPKVLPVSEIVFTFSDEPKVVDYAAKWNKDSEEYKNTIPVCPAKMSSEMICTLEKIALKAYSTFLCRDYARIDIRIKGRKPYILEVNPNPDISKDGGFRRSLNAAGIPFEEFIKMIILAALRRRQL